MHEVSRILGSYVTPYVLLYVSNEHQFTGRVGMCTLGVTPEGSSRIPHRVYQLSIPPAHHDLALESSWIAWLALNRPSND